MTHLVRITHHNGAVRILKLDASRGTKTDHRSVEALARQLDGHKYSHHTTTKLE